MKRFLERECSVNKSKWGDELSALWQAYGRFCGQVGEDLLGNRKDFAACLRALGHESYKGAGGRTRFRGVHVARPHDVVDDDGTFDKLRREQRDLEMLREARRATLAHLALCSPERLEVLQEIVGRIDEDAVSVARRQADRIGDEEKKRGIGRRRGLGRAHAEWLVKFLDRALGARETVEARRNSRFELPEDADVWRVLVKLQKTIQLSHRALAAGDKAELIRLVGQTDALLGVLQDESENDSWPRELYDAIAELLREVLLIREATFYDTGTRLRPASRADVEAGLCARFSMERLSKQAMREKLDGDMDNVFMAILGATNYEYLVLDEIDRADRLRRLGQAVEVNHHLFDEAAEYLLAMLGALLEIEPDDQLRTRVAEWIENDIPLSLREG